jgi:hypothetical protein
VQLAREVEQVAVDLPARFLDATRNHEGAIRLKNHPRHRFEDRCSIFPRAGKRRFFGIGEEIYVEAIHSSSNFTTECTEVTE